MYNSKDFELFENNFIQNNYINNHDIIKLN